MDDPGGVVGRPVVEDDDLEVGHVDLRQQGFQAVGDATGLVAYGEQDRDFVADNGARLRHAEPPKVVDRVGGPDDGGRRANRHSGPAQAPRRQSRPAHSDQAYGMATSPMAIPP